MFVRKNEWDQYAWNVNMKEFSLLLKTSIRVMKDA